MRKQKQQEQARLVHTSRRSNYAEATTNNENEPRRAALNMKPARERNGASTPRRKLNGEAAESATYANRSSKPVSYTHTPTKSFKQINGRRRLAQNAGAEHMKRA